MRSFVVLVLLLPGCAGRSACFDQPWMMRSEDFRSSYLHAIERADGTLSEPAEIVWATNERSLLAYPPDGGTARVGFAVEAWFGAVEDSTCLGGLARADAPAVPAVERPVARVDFTVDLVPTTANDVLGPVEPASRSSISRATPLRSSASNGTKRGSSCASRRLAPT